MPVALLAFGLRAAGSSAGSRLYVTDKKKAILLRISPELWEQLNRWAADELRSLNAQIEYVLRESVRRRARDDRESPPSEES
jgi:hypothetical protein